MRVCRGVEEGVLEVEEGGYVVVSGRIRRNRALGCVRGCV